MDGPRLAFVQPLARHRTLHKERRRLGAEILAGEINACLLIL